MSDVLEEINVFLGSSTPDAWLKMAVQHQDILLIDHAHCEKKAASTAMNLMFRYVERPDLLYKMARLAREELVHFEQVMTIMQDRGVEYCHLSPARYATRMRNIIRNTEPERLIDLLIIGAFIEARSCKRFAKLIPLLDSDLAKFYRLLVKSEGRHYQDYLALAASYAAEPIDSRVAEFQQLEQELIATKDDEFRFHSGVPSSAISI